jgi:hypothetical protein
MTEDRKASKPWDFSPVQRLINDLPATPQPHRGSPSCKNQTLPTPASSVAPVRHGIGDLTPVFSLLDKFNTEAPAFRELDRLPLPSWSGRADLVDREAYASDGAASVRTFNRSKTPRKVLWESSEDEQIFGSFESDTDFKNTQKPKAKKGKKKKIQTPKLASRQAVSDGEAMKPTYKVKRRPVLPAVKAASHQITSQNKNQISDTRAAGSNDSLIPEAPIPALSGSGANNKLTVRFRSKSASNLTINTPFKQVASNPSTILVDSWIQRDRVERDLAFRLKLIQSFPEDRLTLSQTVAFKQVSGSNSIHVFIDFSNIWIGYMVHLQRLMGLPKHARLKPDQRNLSFESLVFLLERGRHAEKRILAGSWPWLPAFDTAKAIGYDSNILEKVQKNRSLTDEQRRTQHATSRKSGDFSSGSTTLQPNVLTQVGSSRHSIGPGIPIPSKVPSAQQLPAMPLLASSPEKWVEQGVDELLQLKMSHSLLDYDEPSIIVLATGDGAEAEYSDGFARMLERVLNRGWKVELVSWKHCVNSVYSKRSWLERWPPGQFRFIALEPYAEFLLECAQD